MLKIVIAFLLLMGLMAGVVYADEIRQNITVDGSYEANGTTFFMCNIRSEVPDTVLPFVRNCTFNRCNLYGVEVDGTNLLIKSNVIDTTYVPPEPSAEEQLEKKTARVAQLEKFIGDNSLPVPKEVIQ